MNRETAYTVDVYIFDQYEKTIDLPFIPHKGMSLRGVSEKGCSVYCVEWDAETGEVKVYLKPYLSNLYILEKPKTEIEHVMTFYNFFFKDNDLNDTEKKTFQLAISQINKVNEVVFGAVKAREMFEASQTMSEIQLNIKNNSSYSQFIQSKNEDEK